MARVEPDSSAGPMLVVGADGRIGHALRQALAAQGIATLGTALPPAPPDCRPLDLADPPDRWQLPEAVGTVFLCAAITSLEACRSDPSGSRLINVERTVELARRLAASGARIVFLSSNLVYDGSRPLCRADEPVCPTTEYGRQKAEAERRLLTLGDPATVVRLTKVVAADTAPFAAWRTSLVRGEPIQPFSDMVMAPVGLALAVETIGRAARRRLPGIFQLSAERDITYAEAARRMAVRLGADPALVRPLRASEKIVLHDPLPRHTTLDTSRVRNELGLATELVDAALELFSQPDFDT